MHEINLPPYLPLSNTAHRIDKCIFLYYISIMEKADFEWDDQKDAANRLKHGVSFHEAQYAFADPHRIIVEDIQHAKAEERFFCIGRINNAIMTVRFTMRGGKIRIIGAGYWRRVKNCMSKKIHYTDEPVDRKGRARFPAPTGKSALQKRAGSDTAPG